MHLIIILINTIILILKWTILTFLKYYYGCTKAEDIKIQKGHEKIS